MAGVDIELAVDEALSHAQRRRRTLTAVTLAGDDARAHERAKEVLRRRGHEEVEVHIARREGPVRLLAIEVAAADAAR